MCDQKGPAFCTGVFTPLAVGIPIAIWGIATHASAVKAAQSGSSDSARARVFVSPVVGTQRGEPSGAAVVGTF